MKPLKEYVISTELQALAESKGWDRFDYQEPITISYEDTKFNHYPIVTLEVLHKWLRDIHGIYILPIPVVTMGYTYKLLKVWKRDFEPLDIEIAIESAPYDKVNAFDYGSY